MALQNGFTISDKLARTTAARLFGPGYMISEVFSFDGRDEDEYGHVFEWEDLTDPIWVEGSYAIRGCIDFDPDCVLLTHEGESVGFYMGGQAWIDPGHRGNGLGARMIVSTIAMSGRLPDVRDIGFSEAGFAAHEAALKLLKELKAVPRIAV